MTTQREQPDSSLSATGTDVPSATVTRTMSETTRGPGTHVAGTQEAPATRSPGAGLGMGTAGSSTGPTGAEPRGGKEGGVKRAVAGVHGAGEEIRGKVGEIVDRAAGDTEGVARNEEVERQGREEIETGRFSRETVEREVGKPERERERQGV
ncbi:hypothetical protein PRK78_005669 [Emydomyces testavorans]|uniref:CsbD-like domain-containing protein n=1 Tax=Emydomyces testavorans TaxID=2070801 RepID=A0AAF0DL01_9EURO|nr:hypothetical protein PRK78_005669 [Emydomyces testavorans]